MTVDEIARAMTGQLRKVSPGRDEAFLPSPMVQNHAAFLHGFSDGAVACVWFGGSLEGKADISIRASVLEKGADHWGPVTTLSHDPDHSEQNPVLFAAPDGETYLFHTSQPSGNQDECRIRMARVIRGKAGLATEHGHYLDLPKGCFIRAPLMVLQDGSWLLPIFRCTQRPGQKWTGSHDVAAIGISRDGGKSWDYSEISGSTGSVHMSPVSLGDHMVALFRRRQADMIHRSESRDGGKTWSATAPTDVPNNNSSIAALRLRGGELAVICNPVNAAMDPARRASLYDELGEDDARPDASSDGGCVPVWGVARAPVALCLSTDGGRHFAQRFLVEDGDGTCLSNNSVDGKNKEMSYPWLLETADGCLNLAYTYHRRAIKHVRLGPDWRQQLPQL